MKKLLIIIALFFLLSSHLFSITFPFYAGIKAGISGFSLLGYNTLWEQDVDEESHGLFGGGFTFEYKFNDWISINIDTLWNPKSAKYNIDIPELPLFFANGFTSIIRFDYISIPVYFRLHVKYSIFIEGGFEYSIIVNKKNYVEYFNGEPVGEINVDEMINNNDYGYLLGMGVVLKEGRNKYTVGVRYVKGQKNLINNQNDPIYSSTIQGYISVAIGIH